jgi:CDP-diglyceride synthetase
VSNWPIVVVCVVVLTYGMIHGLLMLISPDTHRRFNIRVNDPFGRIKLPPRDRDPNRGLELEYRLAGLAGVLVCVLIAWGTLDSLLGHHYGEPLPKHGTTPTIAFGKSWRGFVAAAGCLVFGAYAFLRPLSVYGWTTLRLLPSGVAVPEPNQIRRGMRFLGTCFIVLALILFWLELKQQ